MISGFNTVRIFALMLVTWQHAASVLGYYETTQWLGISPGQVGVSIFCAISGFLALYSKPASLSDWFVNRMIRIFPAYWLATVGAFALALIGSDKEITVWLFFSQMLGLGYFTHGWNLVNVVSWFISLLLFCYLLAVVSLRSGWPKLLLGIVFLSALIICVTRIEVSLSRHVMTFSLAGLLALRMNVVVLSIISVSLLISGMTFDPQFFYAGFAMLLLGLVRSGYLVDFAFVDRAANYSYEYFLIHGVCLVAAVRFIPNQWLGVFLAVSLAIMGAFILNKFSSHIIFILRKKMAGYSNVVIASR